MDLSIKLHPHGPSYASKQPKSTILPPTPCRGLLIGPSGSGKTAVLVDFCVRLYRGVFERIVIFSPSIHLDHTWLPVKQYVREVLGVDETREPCFFDTWDTAALRDIYETQVEVIKEQKKRKMKQLYNICLIVDDFADDSKAMHQQGGYTSGGSMLNTLFIRGRHSMTSCLISSQKLRLVSSTIRVNAQFMLIWRLRNAKELDSLIEELSAVYDKKTLLQMYELATSEPYSFWYVLLTAQRKEDMFYLRFEQRMIPNNKTWEQPSDSLAPLQALPPVPQQ